MVKHPHLSLLISTNLSFYEASAEKIKKTFLTNQTVQWKWALSEGTLTLKEIKDSISGPDEELRKSLFLEQIEELRKCEASFSSEEKKITDSKPTQSKIGKKNNVPTFEDRKTEKAKSTLTKDNQNLSIGQHQQGNNEVDVDEDVRKKEVKTVIKLQKNLKALGKSTEEINQIGKERFGDIYDEYKLAK